MATQPAEQPVVKLRLYVGGNGPNSLLARANIARFCDGEHELACDLEIVDLLEFPLRALADGVIVTPTLLRLSPLPARRIVGNLSDRDKVLLLLGAL